MYLHVCPRTHVLPSRKGTPSGVPQTHPPPSIPRRGTSALADYGTRQGFDEGHPQTNSPNPRVAPRVRCTAARLGIGCKPTVAGCRNHHQPHTHTPAGRARLQACHKSTHRHPSRAQSLAALSRGMATRDIRPPGLRYPSGLQRGTSANKPAKPRVAPRVRCTAPRLGIGCEPTLAGCRNHHQTHNHPSRKGTPSGVPQTHPPPSIPTAVPRSITARDGDEGHPPSRLTVPVRALTRDIRKRTRQNPCASHLASAAPRLGWASAASQP